MEDNIKSKLKIELKKPIEGESQVVYILTCIRKILDYNQQLSSKYTNLRFYSNWALHIEINKDHQIFKTIAPHLMEALVTKSEAEGNIAVGKLISSFDTDFLSFLKELNLPQTCYDSEDKKVKFRHHLLNVMKDIPVIVFARKIEFNIGSVVLRNGSEPQIGWSAKIIG